LTVDPDGAKVKTPNTHTITINPGGFTLTKVSVRGIYTNVLYIFTLGSSDITINLEKKILEIIVHWSLDYQYDQELIRMHFK
jgi:hypothetical protein